MKASPEKIEEFRNIISQNALKGESYYIKFKGDANLYLGIPVLRANLSREDEDSFDFNVFEPSEKKGVLQKSLNLIEFLEKR